MIIHWDFVKKKTLWSYEDLTGPFGGVDRHSCRVSPALDPPGRSSTPGLCAGKTVRHLCGGGYDALAKLAAADPPELEAAMNAYYHSLGKRPTDFKAVVQLAPLIGGARSLPQVVEA